MTRGNRRPSPSMIVALMALFVALSGASYAAIKANTVGAKAIKANAVRAAEIKDGVVGTAEVTNSALTGEDIANESLGSPDVNGLGSGDIAEESLTGNDVLNESLDTNDVQGLTRGDFAGGELPPQAFARVQADGTLQPDVDTFTPQSVGLDPTDVVKGEGGAATGTYCFGSLPFERISSAQVTLDNADAAAADRNLIASVAIDRGQDLGDCPPEFNQARVRIVDGNTEAAQDARFFIWFLR